MAMRRMVNVDRPYRSIKKNLNAESENLQLIQPKAKVNQVYLDYIENLIGSGKAEIKDLQTMLR